MPSKAINELAMLLRRTSQDGGTEVLAEQLDDFGTVIDTDELEVRLHDSGASIFEDHIYFTSNCPPAKLEVGDIVLVIVIASEHVIVDKVLYGPKARDQTPVARP